MSFSGKKPSENNPTGREPKGRRMVEEEGRIKKKRVRDLKKALWLRPIEVFEDYGIPPSTLCFLCRHEDESRRLPSRLIPGRMGRKGLRLINRAELDAYLDRYPGGN